MSRIPAGIISFFLATFIVATGAPSRAAEEYKKVTGPCHLTFPEDHGEHPEYRTEWWYYTGNLTAEDGRRYGFQLTFFRSALPPPAPPSALPEEASRWRTRQVYMAHAALTDIGAARHWSAEKIARGAMGLAGVSRKDDQVAVTLLDWQTLMEPDGHRLKAASHGHFALDLLLAPLKEPVLHGEAGYSRKGRLPDQASCYYSLTRLAASGSIRVNERSFKVTGTGWMDHEFSSAPLEPGILGWDWFSLQFSDNSELMIFFLREANGVLHPASSGSYVAPDGRVRNLTLQDMRLAVTDHWKSPASGARYPSRWQLDIPALDLDLIITPNAADQEMVTPRTTRVTYWEGSVDITGSRRARAVEGVGYVEMTGYAEAFRAPL